MMTHPHKDNDGIDVFSIDERDDNNSYDCDLLEIDLLISDLYSSSEDILKVEDDDDDDSGGVDKVIVSLSNQEHSNDPIEGVIHGATEAAPPPKAMMMDYLNPLDQLFLQQEEEADISSGFIERNSEDVVTTPRTLHQFTTSNNVSIETDTTGKTLHPLSLQCMNEDDLNWFNEEDARALVAFLEGIPAFVDTKSTAIKGANKMNARKPMPDIFEYVEQPNAADVLLGRGAQTNAHPGNIYFRSMAKMWHFKEYTHASTKRKKKEIAWALVRTIQTCGGRFLQKEGTKWFVVHDDTARSKATQALRESAMTQEERRIKRKRYPATPRRSKGSSNKRIITLSHG